MSNLYRRNGNIFKANSTVATQPDFASGYDVTAFEVGAQANGAQTGVSTITVHAGHGIAANDKFMVGTATNKFFVADSVTATTVVIQGGSTTTVSDDELILNLGADTGTLSPNYDGSGVTTYSDGAGNSAISNSRVDCDSEGGYGYWLSDAQAWELIRDGSNTPVEIVPDVRPVSELQGSVTFDPTSLADGAGETKQLTVTGAALGDFVLVSAPYDLQDMTATAYVQAADTVEIRLQNESGGVIDLASGTWKVRVIK